MGIGYRMIGKTLGHYRILDRLGAGGMGVVWLAEDLALGRKVALKTLRADLAETHEKKLRFDREARSVAALNHPNIVTLHSVEEADGIRFLTMEYVEGKTLLHRILPGGAPPSDFLRIGAEIADALAAAHEAGIVHRDLKPGNILIAKNGRVKVVDFGLARATQGDALLGDVSRQTSLTKDGLAIGTLNYMSPEQLANRPVDHRSDLFALGVVLFELATGDMPFMGESAAQLISSVMRDRARRIDEGQTKLPPQIVDLVDSLLAKEPIERPESAAVVAERLRAATKLLDSDTVGVSSTPARRAISAPLPRPEPSAPVRAHSPLRRVVVLAAIAAAALGLVLAARQMLSHETPAASAAVGRPEAKAPTIAVLPLGNFSGEPDYFIDGMTDSLINSLAKTRGLRVISRQSVMRFRGSDLALPQIARELGTELLVEGSVSRAGERIHLEIKLVRAEPEETIASESFDRPAAEILGLNDDAASTVARAAGVASVAGQRSGPMEEVDPSTYDRLLRAQYASNQLTPESLEQAISLFKEVLADSPDSATAWAGLAVDYGLLGFFRMPPLEAAAHAEEAARNALRIDPSSAEAHGALGFVQHFYRWDWAGAEASYRRALERNPNDASSHHRLWGLLVLLDRWDEADRELELASRLDPLSVSIATNVGQNLGLRGDLEGAIAALQKALRLEPNYGVAENHLWAIYHELGREPERSQTLVHHLRSLGLPETADATERELRTHGYDAAVKRAAESMASEASRRGLWAYSVAELFAAAGAQDEAIAWLRRSYVERAPEMSWIAVARAFIPLRDRPEFRELLRGLRLEPRDGRSKNPGN